ncbi:MAG: two-component system response regulator [Candidatus Melainabacteria bacterium HGW-Melainabacteria-1]|nr:MAG: two-component system response regulator [Candidatus Melainabacteria bacterium HGW-Melainabacteria-1]
MKSQKRDTVLLLEDNVLNQAMLTRRLSKTGFSVIERENGLNITKVIEETHPDLILLDILLPEVDGLTIASNLKASAETAMIPVIAVTASAMRGDREKALAAGCDAYISKPIDFPLLLSTMQNLLERYRQVKSNLAGFTESKPLK